MTANIKVVHIKKTHNVVPILHQWEEVYWPFTKGQVRQQQSNADSIPDQKIWKKFKCLVKSSNMFLYMNAQVDPIRAVEDNSSDYSTTDDYKGKSAPIKSVF